jgi:ankyrin repeat protein
MKAATRGASDCVKHLEDRSDASLRDHRGRTAAMHAVVNGRKRFLQEMAEVFEGPLPAVNVGVWVHPFLAADALRVTDNEGKTALQLADEQKQAEIAALLRGYLDKVIDKETQVIAKSGVAGGNYIPMNYRPMHYRYRAFAIQARGDSAEAAADLEEAERLELQKKP